MILRTAGLAAVYERRYDSPIDARLVGVNVNQSDDPWWLVEVLGWLSMYRNIHTSSWEQAEAYQAEIELRFKRESPSCLYDIYKRFCMMFESDMRAQKAKARARR